MAFAQPLALWFLILAIPITLLYLLKQRRRRVQVSTLLFWDQILRDEHAVTSMTKLRKLLSLFLQLLILTLLALALAQPVFSRDLLGARRVVVLLDISGSMATREDEGVRFDQGKDVASNVFKGMSIGDSGMLVTVGQAPDIVVPLTDSRKLLLDALDGATLTHGATNFEHALALLQNLPPDERETLVYIISDGAFERLEFDPPERMRFAYMSLGREEKNMGITACQLRPLPASPRDFEILFEVVNHTGDVRTVPYEVTLGGLLIDAGEMEVPKDGKHVQTVRQFSQSGGDLEVSIDYEDAFDVDNHAYAILPPPRPVPVILVTDGNLFLEAALMTDDEIELATAAPDGLAERLTDWPHSADDTVFIFDRCLPGDVAYSNAVFIHAWPDSLGPKITGDIAEPLIADWDREHPINRHLHLMNVKIQQAVKVEADDSWATLVAAIDDPLVLWREQDNQKVVLIAFDTASSDLPLRVAFPILVANAVRHISGIASETSWVSHSVGDTLTYSDLEALLLERHPDHTDAEQPPVFALARPGDSPPSAGDPDAFAEATLDPLALVPLDRAGVYTALDSEGHRVALLAAGLNNARESDIAPAESLPVMTDEPLPLVEDGLRLGTEPWLLLAMLAVAMLTAEWFLFHRRWSE